MGWRSRALIEASVGEATAESHLAMAYKEIFAGESEAKELVLVDLATHCKMFQFEARGLSVEDANYFNGQRAAFARILQYLSLSEADLAALVEAARFEAAQTEE